MASPTDHAVTDLGPATRRRPSPARCTADAPGRGQLPPAHPGGSALAEWRIRGRRGIVSVPTVAARADLGIAAVDDHVRRAGNQAVVLVQTPQSLEYWYERLSAELPWASVSRLGDGYTAVGFEDIVVALVSVARHERADSVLAGRSLVVADDCHLLASPRAARALRPEHGDRLGLTADLDPFDDGFAVTRYFGVSVLERDFPRPGVAGGRRRVTIVQVPLTDTERDRYDAAERDLRRHEHALADLLGAVPEPNRIAALARSAQFHLPEVALARDWLEARDARRRVTGGCEGKRSTLTRLVPALLGRPGVVHVDSPDTARIVADTCAARWLPAAVWPARADLAQRDDTRRAFDAGDIELLLTGDARDTPPSRAAVLASAACSRRDMIERLEALVGNGADDVSLVVLAAADTFEDPDVDEGRAAFLDVVSLLDDVALRLRSAELIEQDAAAPRRALTLVKSPDQLRRRTGVGARTARTA